MKLQDSLKSWDGPICEVLTDEDLKDICLAIKYHDHGDEFLYIRTYSGEQYKYGYWFDRINFIEDFDINRNNGEADSIHIKRPILYKMPDEKCRLSNKIFFILENNTYGIRDHMSFGPQKYDNAKHRLEMILRDIENTLNMNEDIMYNFEKYRKELLIFIAINELDQECIDKVNRIKWNSRINGFDGIAGKRKSDNILVGDGVIEVLYRGKGYDIDKLTYSKCSYDSFGSWTYQLNTNQFI